MLGRDVRFRCKICPDGIGQYADLVVGDAWHTKDGYPDFTEQEGRSFLLARNARGAELAEKARDAGILSLSPLDIRGLEQMQPYQYQRLRNAFYKLVPAWIVTGGLLKIRHLGLPHFPTRKGLRTALGTVYRYYRR